MKRLALALACVLPLAACGGGSGSDATSTSRAPVSSTTTTATDAPTTTTGAAPAAETTTGAAPAATGDGRIAEAAVLRRDDFAAGWKAKDDDGRSAPSPCPDIRRARAAVSGRFVGPTFSRGGTLVESTVYLYADEAGAAGASRLLTSTGTRRCTAGIVAREVTSEVHGASVGRPAVGGVRRERVGDRADAFEIVLPVRTKGRTIPFPIRLTVVRQGRGLSVLVTQALADRRIARQLEQVAARRLELALDAG